MKKVKDIIKNIDKRYIIIFAVTFFVFMPFMSKRFIEGHDYITHISNLYAMTESTGLSKIRGVMCNNLGYANGIFYPPLPYYITFIAYKILNIVGLSMISTIKVVEFLIVLLSGIFMYQFTNKVFKNKWTALVSAIMYITMPYFITDVFIRMAYAEIFMFLFMPIVMMSIYYILEKDYKKFMIYFIIGYSGMIYSHLVMTLFFTIGLIIILLINIKQLLNKETIISFIIATVMVLGITAPFTVPMLEHKVKGEYVVFNDGSMSTVKKITKEKMDIEDYFNEKVLRLDVPTYVNIIVSIFAIISIVKSKKLIQDNKQKKWFYGIICFTLFSMLISSKLINWNKMPKVLLNIQFPWRMCTFIAFGMSIIASLAINNFKGDSKRIAFMIVLIICLNTSSMVMYKSKTRSMKPVTYSQASATNNRAMGAQNEYLPVKSKKNIKYINDRSQNIIVKSGNAEITDEYSKTPYFSANVKVKENDVAKLELPRIFYYGYNITLEKEDGTTEKVNYYENDKGFIEFELKDSGKIIVRYTGTTLSKVADVVAVILVVMFVGYVVRYEKIKEKIKGASFYNEQEK